MKTMAWDAALQPEWDWDVEGVGIHGLQLILA